MKFVQLSGVGRAGKTTVANYIIDIAIKEGYIPVIIPFAKALKDAVAEDGITKDTHPEEYRSRCQSKGAELRRTDPDYFVNKIREEVEQLKEDELILKSHKSKVFEHLVIQDDVRYMNEIAFGREVGAYQIFVSPNDRTLPELLAPWRDHESEQLCNEVELGNTQFTDIYHEFLLNNGTEEDLRAKVNDRFLSWLTEEEQANDSISLQYRRGDAPNAQFLVRLMVKENQITPEDLDKFLGTLEDLDDDYGYHEGAD